MWFALFGGIALLGLVTFVLLARHLWRKTSALFAELGVLAERGGDLLDLLGQIGVPDERT